MSMSSASSNCFVSARGGPSYASPSSKGVANVFGKGVGKGSGADASTSFLAAAFVGGIAMRVVSNKKTRVVARGYGGGRGGSNLSAAEIRVLSEQKQVRETNDFERQQAMYEKNGVAPIPESRWLSEERKLFKTDHVTAGINFKKYADIPVETEGGQGTETSIETFQDACSQFGLHADLTANVERCGYNVPTPVQKHAIPAVLGGSDVLVTAQTGSGKTAAFLVPIVAAALKAGPKPFRKGPACPTSVVLAPTRELCQQIAEEAQRLCFRSSCRVVEIYGGAPSGPQLAGLSKGCEIIVCTPGRLEDFLNRDFISMKEVQFLALDEADRMLDMGFEPSIRAIVENYGMPAPGVGDEGRQTMMFSATFPQEMQDMALDYLHPAYYMIKVGRVGVTNADVEQRFVDASNTWDKTAMLTDILRQVTNADGTVSKTIVFANQKRVVDDITRHLASQRISAVPVHGDIEQRERNQAIADLKSGRVSVLVATDVAARGLDLPGVAHVVNFDLPTNEDDYVHRIGRTGRIGNKGIATSFVGKNDGALKSIVKAMKVRLGEDASATPVPQWMEDLAEMRR